MPEPSSGHHDAVAEVSARYWLSEIHHFHSDKPERATAAFKKLDRELMTNPNMRKYVIERLVCIAGIMISEEWDLDQEEKTDAA